MLMAYWNWKELKETIGFKKFKKDYVRIFNTYHSDRIKIKNGHRQPRIYDDDKCENESILNYLNTNVSAYTHIVNETLKKISFNPTTDDGYEVMMGYVLNDKLFWFDILLPKIMSIISYTSSKGGEKENIVKVKLTKHFGERFKVNLIGGLGNLKDMNEGVDLTIENKSKSYLAQIKSCKSITLTEDVYKIEYFGINKLYSRNDYIIFVLKDKVHVFDNKLIERYDDGYIGKKESLKLIL